jgi:hypothetical protein
MDEGLVDGSSTDIRMFLNFFNEVTGARIKHTTPAVGWKFED